jgi:hypothetical protein
MSPLTATAFYRRSAVEQMGGFPTRVGDDLLALDMAMMVAEAGMRTTLALNCQMIGDGADRDGTFRMALEAERFFWRWAPRFGWARSLVLHPMVFLQEVFRPARIAVRVCGLTAIGSHAVHRRPREADPAEPVEPAAPAPALEGPHFRFDASHRKSACRDLRASDY